MATTSFPSVLFYFCMFLLCHGSMAQLFGQSFTLWQSSRQAGLRGCKFDRLQAFEPLRQVRSQAGITEYFDERNEQFRCTGVSVIRRVIEPRGLLVPRYHNAHALVYILQGRGVTGLSFPSCPATFQQQFQPFGQGQFAEGQSQQFKDEHQKVHHFEQGDVVALPAGIVHWSYNNGDAPIVAVYVFDVNNNANQLEPKQKNAILSPFWNINAHSVVYIIQGHARVQVVNNHGRTVFNDRLRQGQLLIIPQHFVVLKKAEREGCQYISFKTNANSMVSHITGKNSILRSLPVDVLANAYRISNQEARNLKNNRGEEFGAFTPKFTERSFQNYLDNYEESSLINKA